jgi:SpoVK/Ycf46/Vps4 family AAA+-type ATPase
MPEKFWAVDEGEWRLVEGTIHKELNPGLYKLTVRERMMGPATISLSEMAPSTDKLLPLPDSLCEYIVDSIAKFWKNEHKYQKMGLVHKRGLLLDGPPGCGKTAICLLVGLEIGRRGGVAIFTSPKTNIAALPEILRMVREAHPNMPIINIIEDIDKHKRQVDTLLPLLDGENQVSNIFHIATTNFRDKLDDRLTNRPSRFDEVIKVKPPLKRAREAYLKAIFPDGDIPSETLKLVVRHAQGLNFSHLKELAVATYVYEVDPAKTAAKLKALAENRSMGFRDDEDEEED